MLTDVTFQYMGNPQKQGGRLEVEAEYNAKIFFHPSVDISSTRGQKLWEMGIDVTASVLFESSLPPIEDQKVNMVHIATGKVYEIYKVVPATKDLGLDGSYQLMLKELKSRND